MSIEAPRHIERDSHARRTIKAGLPAVRATVAALCSFDSVQQTCATWCAGARLRLVRIFRSTAGLLWGSDATLGPLPGGRHQLMAIIAGLTILLGACSDSSSPTTPSPVDPTPPAEEVPTTTERWDTVVPVGGAVFFSFSVGQRGPINVTLLSVSGQFVPPTVMLGLGIGTPDGTICVTTTSITAQAGTAPQVTGTFDPGLYCAAVSDVGNLFAPATVSVSIEHP